MTSKIEEKTRRLPPNAGKGRPKGATNKNSQMIKDMIVTALDELGGVEYLVECAHDPKTKAAFLGLIGKVMPVQVVGDPENPLRSAITLEITGVPTHTG